MPQQHCKFLAIVIWIVCSSLIFENHLVSSFECYKCETEVYEGVNDMEKDNCYTLDDTSLIEKCQTTIPKCIAMELKKMDNETANK